MRVRVRNVLGFLRLDKVVLDNDIQLKIFPDMNHLIGTMMYEIENC